MEWFWAGLLGGLGYAVAGLLIVTGFAILIILLGCGKAMCDVVRRK